MKPFGFTNIFRHSFFQASSKTIDYQDSVRGANAAFYGANAKNPADNLPGEFNVLLLECDC